MFFISIHPREWLTSWLRYVMRPAGDIMENPELLEKPLGATKSGAWWWWKHGLNELADKDDVVAVTKRINGGTNGLASRKRWLAKCKNVLCS